MDKLRASEIWTILDPGAGDTRQGILDTARGLFNEAGIARVGVREIARALEMSPGNLAYHFATKDELVAALVKELHARINAEVGAGTSAEPSLAGFYRAAQAAMRDLLAYRFVLLSYVEAVRASPELQALAAEHLAWRRQRQDLLLEARTGPATWTGARRGPAGLVEDGSRAVSGRAKNLPNLFTRGDDTFREHACLGRRLRQRGSKVISLRHIELQS